MLLDDEAVALALELSSARLLVFEKSRLRL
jgi:hypothetical protein